MKHLPLVVLILLLGGSIYLRFQQPKNWNKILDALRADNGGGTPASPATPEATATATGTAPAPKKKGGVVYITPDSKDYLNSGHINDVPQPAQSNQSTSPSTATSKVYVPPSPLPYQTAWVWTTSDGKIFHNVIIEKAEADRVSIFYDQGSAVLEMAVLSADVQRLLNYDPDLAAAAFAARQKTAKDGAAPAGP